jgi:predicted nuclease with RNAse H fold
MSDVEPVFIGVDTTAGKRPSTIAIVSASLRILHLESRPLNQVIQMIADHPNVVCGVDAPIEHSRSLLTDPKTRERMGLNPSQHNYSSYRVCEYDLRRRGIYSYKTPVERQKAPTWMQESWRLYDHLRAMGFAPYPSRGPRVMFETYPHAAYTMLIKKRPYPKDSLEGRIQRQLLLYREGVEVPDAMECFEEWTRHRFISGDLPMDNLYEHDALDALIAAYTAFMLHREPQNVTAIGELSDGQIFVPVPVTDLLEVYN